MSKKSHPTDNTQAGGGKSPPAGKRSGKGSSSVVPYLNEAINSRPAPLEPEGEPPPRKRPFWRR
jgi:hypothetical protein